MPDPECPRCGYDLSGIVASWTDSCPVEGTCSECGLAFAWCNTLNPDYTRVRGLFEHARGPAPRAFTATVLGALWPPALWRKVQMHHRTTWGRLFIFALLGMLGLYLAGAALELVVAAVLARAWRPHWLDVELPIVLRTVLLPFVRQASPALGWGLWNRAAPDPRVIVVVPTAALMPVAFLIMSDTMSRARVRWSHVWRVWLYGWIPIPAIMLSWRFILLGIDYFRPGSAAAMLSVPLVVGSLWLTWWWGLACRRYLHLPRAWAVAAVMTVVCTLAVVTVLVVLSVLTGRM